MDKQQLFENIKRKKSFLCVGLDTCKSEDARFLSWFRCLQKGRS